MSSIAGHHAERRSGLGVGSGEWKISEVIQSEENGVKRVMVEKTLCDARDSTLFGAGSTGDEMKARTWNI